MKIYLRHNFIQISDYSYQVSGERSMLSLTSDFSSYLSCAMLPEGGESMK
ncbi:Uncharacterized protein dnm_059540 [Desulfonema magnum]|uniref:Uncharacterized protein n=1 Tax=Desulfonema magnum TaxID=45655 RepID=A0A975GQH1_9BACT|nr:Uncharacterized protein dnm_059540 [Desulfonema magnum]